MSVSDMSGESLKLKFNCYFPEDELPCNPGVRVRTRHLLHSGQPAKPPI